VTRAIALIDGEHHPAAVRDALDSLDPVAVVFLGGEEKVRAGVLEDPVPHYGRPLAVGDPWELLPGLAADADAVVDLADEPLHPAAAKLRIASLALHLGLAYEAPGMRLEPPRYAPLDTTARKLAVIATGKRTGKTAVAGHWAALLRERGARPVIVSMGRGGPAEPVLAGPETALEDLLAIAADGRHAASDYLEDAALAGVPAVGCRRVGGGLAGEPRESNVVEGARLAAGLDTGAIILEGSGGCIPPVEADRTVCIAGDPEAALGALGPYRLLRADLVLARDEIPGLAEAAKGEVARFTLRPEPAETVPADARVALFTTGAPACEGADPVVASSALARRAELAGDIDRAVTERCDVWLTEIKAAGIDTVAARARREGARVVFVRNRPVGVGCDLDAMLVKLYEA